MASKTRNEAMKAHAAKAQSESMVSMAHNYEVMIHWFADFMIVIDERLKAIEAANGIEYVPPLPDDIDSDEGEETPPTPEPDKPKRGRPRKENANG